MKAEYGKLMMWFFLVSDALTFTGFLTAYGFMRFGHEATWPIAEDVFTHFPGIEGDQPLLYVAFMTFVLIMSSVTMVIAVNAGHQLKKTAVAWWMIATIVGGLIFVGSQAWEWYHFIIGDKGGIELADGRVLKVAEAQTGEVLSLSQLVDGEAGHASNHLEKFGTGEVKTAFEANEGLVLQSPGKGHAQLTRAESLRLIQNAQVVQGANMKHNEYGQGQFANFFFFITGFHGFHVFSGVIFNIIIFYNVLLGTYELVLALRGFSMGFCIHHFLPRLVMSDSSSPSGTRWIWNIFWLLLVVTGVEVALGIIKPTFLLFPLAGTSILNLIFIGLTLVKAAYIVQYFMHLKYETQSLRMAIYLPALVLIPYLTFILLYEGVEVYGY